MTAQRLEPRDAIGFASIGLDEPYRVIISEDPIGLAGGINMFSYVGNNPVNFIDPLGLHGFILWGRNPFIFRYPGVNRPAPGQRYIPPRAMPRPTAPRHCEPVQQPLPKPLPEPSWWQQFLKDAADWLDELGLGGGTGPTLPYDPFYPYPGPEA